MNGESKKVLRVPIILSKDKKHKGWVVPRAETFDFIPKLSCEEECDVIIDGISAKARLTILFRLFYRRNQEKQLAEYLDEITREHDAEIDMQILLNDNEIFDFPSFNNSDDISSLKKRFFEYRKSSEDMKNYLIEINNDLSKKIDTQNHMIDELKKDNEYLSRYIGNLEEKNTLLEKRIKYLSK